MKNIVARMSNQQLIEELLKFCPEGTWDTQGVEFKAAINRYRQIFEALPDGGNEKSLLDVGSRLYMASIYANLLNYSKVSIATKWKSPFTSQEVLTAIPNHERISVDYFDAESSVFPYADNEFDMVVCSELIEHLAIDPVFMLSEVNRVTRDGGKLVLTTPNSASWKTLTCVMAGKHPYSWSAYNGASTDRHNREYTIGELERLVGNCGYEILESKTFSVSGQDFSWKDKLLCAWFSLPDLVRGKPGLDLARLGETSLVICKKTSAVKERYPDWLYYNPHKGFDAKTDLPKDDELEVAA